MKHLESKAAREAQIEKIEDRQSMLSRAWMKADEADRALMDALNDELTHEWIYLRKDKEWLFNFKFGGWNSIMACDKETAIQKAKEEYKNSSSLFVNESTFRISTSEDYKSLLSYY
jgi:hypothetical protein